MNFPMSPLRSPNKYPGSVTCVQSAKFTTAYFLISKWRLTGGRCDINDTIRAVWEDQVSRSGLCKQKGKRRIHFRRPATCLYAKEFVQIIIFGREIWRMFMFVDLPNVFTFKLLSWNNPFICIPIFSRNLRRYH